MKKRLYVSFYLLLFVFSCAKHQDIQDHVEEQIQEAFPGFKIPGNFPKTTYNFEVNPITESGFKLGRDLFYEVKLSRDATISCGSCHMQSSGFTHHGHDVSHGIEDRLGTRNTTPILNFAWRKSFLWDGGVHDLDLQPIIPITDHNEMDENLNTVLDKLRATATYPAKFKAAFGTEEITTARMLRALSQFMLMAISADSKYDKVLRNEAGASFSAEEESGYTIFKLKCASCHTEPLFTDDSFRNNGLGRQAFDDKGRFGITDNPIDLYKFKVPSLRNLRYTAPYMHNGSIYTLAGVLDHYSGTVADMDTLDPLFKNEDGNAVGISLSAVEKKNLLAFLETLNDESFVRNKLLAEQL